MIVSEMGQNDPFQDKINKLNNKIVVSDSGLALFLHFDRDFLIVQHTPDSNKGGTYDIVTTPDTHQSSCDLLSEDKDLENYEQTILGNNQENQLFLGYSYNSQF
jgi:hypothetical protein